MKKIKFNVYEERIIRLLMVAYRPLTTQQISNNTDLSYNTTVKHLRNLKKKRIVSSQSESNRIYWRLIVKLKSS